MATLQTTIATVVYVAMLLAFCLALFLLLNVRTDEEGRWWVRSTYGGSRMRLRSWFWWMVAIAIMFVVVYLGTRIIPNGFPN